MKIHIFMWLNKVLFYLIASLRRLRRILIQLVGVLSMEQGNGIKSRKIVFNEISSLRKPKRTEMKRAV